MSLPNEREVRGEKVEHGAIAIAECPSLAIQHEVAGAGRPDGEEQLHHVVDPEWSADLGMEVEPAELAEAENVGEATRHAEGSNPPCYALRSCSISQLSRARNPPPRCVGDDEPRDRRLPLHRARDGAETP